MLGVMMVMEKGLRRGRAVLETKGAEKECGRCRTEDKIWKDKFLHVDTIRLGKY